jgi:hypothetical protein
MDNFKIEGVMLVTPNGSYDLREISSVQLEEYDMTSDLELAWKCWLKGSPWLIGSCWFCLLTGFWNPVAIVCAAFGFYYIGSDYLRIRIICGARKYTLYKAQWSVTKLWGGDDKGKNKAKELYKYITDEVQQAKQNQQ